MSIGPVRLLHVVGHSEFGGASHVILSLLNMARERGMQVACLASHPTMIEACRDQDLPVVKFEGIVRPIRPLYDMLTTRRLARVLRGKYDIVHTHTTKGGVVGRLAAWKAGISGIVHTVHGFAFHEFSPWWFIRLGAAVERYCAKRCHKIAFVNNSDRQLAQQLGIATEQQRITIYNGIPEERLKEHWEASPRQLRSELGLTDAARLCVFVGRLAKQKGLTYLIDSLSLVRSEHPQLDVHLALVGEGELRDSIADQVRRKGLRGRVHMLGFRTDCLRWTRGGDIFVLPSLWEGHSITLLEAMGMARPIVATDIKGNRETIRHEVNGLLVRPTDPRALAGGIHRLLSDPELAHRLGARAREDFQQDFSLQRMLEKYWQLYCELVANNG